MVQDSESFTELHDNQRRLTIGLYRDYCTITYDNDPKNTQLLYRGSWRY